MLIIKIRNLCLEIGGFDAYYQVYMINMGILTEW